MMTLKIGNNLVSRFTGSRVHGLNPQTRKPANPQTREPANPRTRKGFTLIEVMVTAAVLALGTVLIYEAFFISLDSFNYCSRYLKIASWIDEKIWQVQDSLGHLGPLAQIERSGSFKNENKNFDWDLSYDVIEQTQNLYKIDLAILWQEGKRKAKFSRSAYAMYEEKK